MFTTTELIACVTREIGFRRHVYGRRVASGAMKQAEADREIALMEAVKAKLEAERPQTADMFGGGR